MNFSGVIISSSVANVLYPVFFTLFSVICVLAFVWLMVRYIGKSDTVVAEGKSAGQESKPFNFTALLLVLLVIGFILRLIFVFAVKGFRSDVNIIVNLFTELKVNGFADNYYSDGVGVLPLTYYIYSFMGFFANLFGLDTDSVLMPLLIKLPLIIADLITAYALYKLARKYVNIYVAVIVAGFVSVCPLFVFASGVWATQYSLLALFTVLAFCFLASKNFVATIGFYGAALLTHKDAVYLFPLFAVFIIYGFVKSCILLRKSKSVTFKELLHDVNLRPVFSIPVSTAGFIIAGYLLSLPLMINSFGAGFFTYLYRIFLAPLAAFGFFGHNSLGIFNLFMRNGEQFGQNFPTVIFTVLFAVIITGIVLLVYLSKKNRANLVYLGGYIVMTLATYFVGFSEFSLLPAVAILLTSFLLIRDKRIISIFGIITILMTVNSSSVMANANYYNNLIDHYFSAAGGYTGSEILAGGITAVNIVCSALAVLAHLYATVVLLDISMSNKRKVLPYEDNAKFTKAMSVFFSLKNK